MHSGLSCTQLESFSLWLFLPFEYKYNSWMNYIPIQKLNLQSRASRKSWSQSFVWEPRSPFGIKCSRKVVRVWIWLMTAWHTTGVCFSSPAKQMCVRMSPSEIHAHPLTALAGWPYYVSHHKSMTHAVNWQNPLRQNEGMNSAACEKKTNFKSFCHLSAAG